MCKICSECESIMNYDPYFEAEVCVKCGKMERKKSKEIQEARMYQNKKYEIIKNLIGVMYTN